METVTGTVVAPSWCIFVLETHNTHAKELQIRRAPSHKMHLSFGIAIASYLFLLNPLIHHDVDLCLAPQQPQAVPHRWQPRNTK